MRTRIIKILFSAAVLFYIQLTFAQEKAELKLHKLEQARTDNLLKIVELNNSVVQIAKKISLAEDELENNKTTFNKALASLRKLNQIKIGQWLMPENKNKFERNVKLHQRLQEFNLVKIREYKYMISDLALQKEIYQKQINELNEINSNIQIQENEIRIAEQNALQEMIVSHKQSLLMHKGRLTAPVDALVASKFGPEHDSKNQFTVFNKGLYFNSRPGQLVQVISPGKVVFRDQIKYWGESVIVRHDGDYYSVYTGLVQCHVNVGDAVNLESPFCEVKTDKFYFELRYKRLALNPGLWIKDLK